MKKIHFVIFLLISGCVGIKATDPISYFITADEGGNTLTMVSSYGAHKTIVIPGAPHNVQVSEDGKWILATAMNTKDHKYHSHGSTGGILVLARATQFDLNGIRTIPVNGHLAHVVTDKIGKTAYITDSANNRIILVDVGSAKIKGYVDVGAFPHGIRLNPVRNEVYTANVNDGTISIVNNVKNTEIVRVPVGKKPIQVAVSPDGNRVYVTLAEDNSVAVIDVNKRTKLRSILVGKAPAQIFADPKGRYMYIANQGDKNNPGNTISIIDIASDTVIKTLTTGKMPHGVVVSKDGSFIYVTNMADDSVSQINAETFSVVNSYNVGKMPNGIAIMEGIN